MKWLGHLHFINNLFIVGLHWIVKIINEIPLHPRSQIKKTEAYASVFFIWVFPISSRKLVIFHSTFNHDKLGKKEITFGPIT